MEEATDHFAQKGATQSATDGDPGNDRDATASERETHDQSPVFRAVTGVYRRRGNTLGERERRLLLRVLRQIAPNVDLRTRRELAENIADDQAPDTELVRLFLSDHIDIARPLLQRSNALSSDDLVHLVSARGPEFRRVIAARPELAPEVSAALAETGDLIAIRTLLNNHGARIDPSTFKFMATLARRHTELRTALQRRPDAPEEVTSSLTTKTASDAETTAAALAEKLYDAGHLRVSILIGALRRKQTALFEHAFALLTGLPAQRMQHLLRDPSGFPMALAARAARMDRSAFTTVFVRYCEARGVSPQMDETDLARAMEVFRNLPQEGARAELHRLADLPRQPSPFKRTAAGRFVKL